MIWLYIAITAYFIGAVNAVIDKFLLVGKIPNALAYSFSVGFLSIFILILAPFGLAWPGLSSFLFDLAVGVIFLLYLYVFFSALRTNEASRVVPIVGGLAPIFIFFLSYIFLGERLGLPEISAFILLVSGGALIAVKKSSGRRKYSIEGIGLAVLAAALSAVYYFGAKSVFMNQSFISGFIWTRLGSFLAALFLLFSKSNRRLIFGIVKSAGVKAGWLLVFNKALAGGGFILLNYAVALGSVALVNSMQGIQYVFLLGLAYFIPRKLSLRLEEEYSFGVFAQKTISVILIASGLLMLGYFS
jgi:drug/metabolite transporter (DMT)-like permease